MAVCNLYPFSIHSGFVKMADDGNAPKFDESNDDDLFASAIEVIFSFILGNEV